MELLQTILITLVTLGIVVTIHEFGHFWVARRCGVKVLRFSIGFGQALFRWSDKHGTEFVLAAIPLGGYVKMLDGREQDVPEKDQPYAFNNKPVGQRLAVFAAGPIANLILAVLIYWFLFVGGVTGVAPVIDTVEPGSIAEMASLEAGQEIIAVDGEATPTWEALHFRLLQRIGESGPIDFSVKYPDSDFVYQSQAELNGWLAGSEATDLIGGLGLALYRPALLATIGQVVEASPADAAGLLVDDTILSANGDEIADWISWVEYVRANPGKLIDVVYLRNGGEYSTLLTPATLHEEDGTPYGQVGLGVQVPEWPPGMIRSFSYGVFGSLTKSLEKTGSMALFTLESIKKMLMGLISPKNLSGPITIAKVASATADSGLESYLGFIALFSISLGVLNLLPIPVLDGGHILYGLIELLTGREVSMKIQVLGYQLGLFVIVGVMILALYNDISRL
jgi:regulator of sigma E protease